MRFYWLITLYLLGVLSVIFVVQTSTLVISLISLLTLVFMTILVLGVSIMRLNLFVTSVSKLDTTNNEMAITFDDGPSAENTPQILDILAKYNAKATFFCIGNKLSEHADILKRIIAEGHSVGNHTFEHAPTFPIWSVKKIKESIRNTDTEFTRLDVEINNLFRPPYGVTNNLVAAAIKSLDKKCIGWSIRTKDTCRTPEQVIALVKKRVKPGSIILLHDTNKYVCQELEEILKYCQAQQLNSIALS
ncbi:polysaccharide deacetylase family protein [Carboxylicivirga sp. A043]|uniref:polysaccharide deacetylase family protein n=1 Tax=Carboxylicivirga litoralis TaxID=2816963 RepID=UPI0021CB29CA|nr:polysaccharide deacetylase family protein [Carboxylicivirga sp. A043]MCU4154368.1 polysaccharide deacetylase family protein [Carboxylicivirga sp. A043]